MGLLELRREARHVTFEELDQTREELGKLMEEFEQLDGKWVVDAEVRFLNCPSTFAPDKPARGV